MVPVKVNRVHKLHKRNQMPGEDEHAGLVQLHVGHVAGMLRAYSFLSLAVSCFSHSKTLCSANKGSLLFQFCNTEIISIFGAPRVALGVRWFVCRRRCSDDDDESSQNLNLSQYSLSISRPGWRMVIWRS